MVEVLKNAWKLSDIRQKILFTIAMLVVFRLGVHIPVPGIDTQVIADLIAKGQLLGFFDVISGGAFKKFSIFAMSITPYINASIIMQLLTVVIPYLERLSKEPDGRKKMAQYVRYGTVILGFVQAVGISFGLRKAVVNPGLGSTLLIALSLTAGTAFLMWLGELITEKGIGNGISLIIFAGIVSRVPVGVVSVYEYLKAGTASIFVVLLFAIIALFVMAGIVAIQEGQRRIPVQYAKRVVGRKVYGGQSTHIPLKVNQAGVIPIIFAISILMFPGTIAAWFPTNKFAVVITKIFDFNSWWYQLIYALLIIFFTYFYTAITFNPNDVADNMKKYGGFIPGLRPGRSTAEYIEKVANRVTFAGAVFLAAIAVLPALLISLTALPVYYGGTSLLIVVGVALDTMKQLESNLLMRHYQGFLK
ncbi:MAG: preprotein translocase subunit SecY [Clostridia bacterium]|nr:preprotein translocase subunit SecY [Clostridia bacterium]MDD4145727.1 preprotein translocase subunit SecY [Clostridia bacterium]MDD4665289.1 preprotein translocase subunit SecY [Clostridia bacterium]